MKYKELTPNRLEQLLSLQIDIYEHSEKTKEKEAADQTLKDLMVAQMERVLPEILELQAFFTREQLEEKDLLLKSQRSGKSKKQPQKAQPEKADEKNSAEEKDLNI